MSVYVFDFTIPWESNAKVVTRNDIEKWLKLNAKSWTFKREKGESGYIHWQGRVSLRNRKRIGEQVKVQPFKNHCHWSITSAKNKDNTNYIEKSDELDEDVYTQDNMEEPVYMPRQIREIEKLRPWQERVINMSRIWDPRGIHMIHDPNGNIGKSVLVGYMRCHKLARKLPPLNDYKDVMRCAMDMPVSNCYLFDMPRAMKKDRLGSLYTAIEELKSGYCWDDRYSFKERFFDCPNIFIFANMLPDFTMLSMDRWQIWEVTEDHCLSRFKLDEE